MDRFSRLRRPKNPMPGIVKKALQQNDLEQAYLARPAYQQNDYIGWINRAVRKETKTKRMQQMLDELKKGGVYMRMQWHAGK